MLFECHNITKKFGGILAINNLSFNIYEKEIFGLIGPNGAGKTTMFNLITGCIKPDTGIFRFNGQEITEKEPYDICKRGIARTHQLVKPFVNQTVIQNALVGRFFGNSDNISTSKARKEINPLLKLLGLDEKADRMVKELNIFERKNVELLRALATKPRLLLLDEPASGLSTTELANFIEQIRSISNLGVTICIIEHVMRLVLDLCDRVTVIHHGEKVTEGPPKEVTNDAEVIRLYLGESD